MTMQVDGSHIRELRLAKSWSQEMLAEQAGVSLRTIQRMEIDGVASLQSRRAVAEALGVLAAHLSLTAYRNEPVQPPSNPYRKPVRIGLGARARLAVIAVGSVVLLGLIGGGYLLLSRQHIGLIDSPAEPEVPSRIVTIGYGDIEQKFAAPGTLQPTEIVPVQARVPGKLSEIFVGVGDYVEEGQVLAMMDPEEQQLRVQSAKLSLQQLKNRIPAYELTVKNAESELMRLDDRFTADVDVGPELDQSRRALLEAHTSLDNILLDIQRSETELTGEQIQLNYYEIRAPMSGTVVAIDAREGAILYTEDLPPVIVQITDLTHITVAAEVHEADIGKLGEGTEAYFTTLGSGDRRWPATLRRLDPIGRPPRSNVVAFTARLDVDNASGELYPNMSVQVYFVTARAENVLTVPVSALSLPESFDGSGPAVVTLVRPDDTTTIREIVVGAMDRINAEVLDGLKAGDRVMTSSF